MSIKISYSGFLNENNHPEIMKGEIFLTNATLEEFGRIGWKTKRMGVCAYTIYGKRITSDALYPVFIQKNEVEKAKRNE